MPEWMNMSEWLEPKPIVLMLFIGTVLFLARRGGVERTEPKRLSPPPQRQTAAMPRNVQR
jgi:hypothetical protein